jgi:hypothetical protein
VRIISGKVFFDILLLAAAGGGFAWARNMPTSSGIGSIGAADFPMVICGLAVVAMMGVLWQDLRAASDAEENEKSFGWASIIALGAMGAWLALYIFLFESLGFMITTFAFLVLGIVTCGWAFTAPPDGAAWQRLCIMAVVVAAVATGLALLVFSYGFGLIFP